MNAPYVIREFGKVYRGDGPRQPDAIGLPPRSFDLLRDFVAEQSEGNEEVERAFRYGKRQGEEYVQVRNYVGVIQLSDGTHLEVLPKLLGPEAESIPRTRQVFLSMLRHLRDSPFIGLDQAQLEAEQFPLLEIFIGAYLQELDTLLRRGLQRSYVSHTGNERFLKGRLEVAPHLQRNLLHPERFYVTHDAYALDSPWHRLIKSTLLKLRPLTRVLAHQRRLARQAFSLDEVPPCRTVEADWQALNFSDRQYRRYHQLMRWSRVFLLDQSFTNFQGRQLNLALLFPMERIFEDYVAHWLRRKFPSWNLQLQDRRHHLVEDFEGRRAFGLRPDFVLTRPDGQMVVADAKWKRLDPQRRHPPLGISQADLYQLYAYAQKYRLPGGVSPELWLLYPEQEALHEDRRLVYEEGLELWVRGVGLQ